jgi:hypothetical protein
MRPDGQSAVPDMLEDLRGEPLGQLALSVDQAIIR